LLWAERTPLRFAEMMRMKETFGWGSLG